MNTSSVTLRNLDIKHSQCPSCGYIYSEFDTHTCDTPFTNPFHLTHDLKHLFDITKSIYSNQRTIMATLDEIKAAQARINPSSARVA